MAVQEGSERARKIAHLTGTHSIAGHCALARRHSLTTHSKDATPQETPSTRDLTRRLVDREAARPDLPEGSAVAAHLAIDRACRTLARWLGVAGCHALVARALAQARAEQPILKDVRLNEHPERLLEGVSEAVRTRGATEVAQALETLLFHLLALLGRLIGDDMVARLVEPVAPNDSDEEATRR